ncbi:peptide chain release factor N(5)-glutamine methyltransferase [Alteromonas sp. D210916BOD_24]|uniref:peptide chain release factor N(5)-glutamine methyltransferase n=1 Tax=Alteromonas sp. D210916BOD_24 TaxID=3157618 RepID=UPI00399C4B81
MRIDAALAWATQQLEGGESPSVDAKVLLAHVLDTSQTYLFTWPDKTLSEDAKTQFEQAIARRQTGEPVAYIIGKRDFWTLSLQTSVHTLIPRPDTEVLVETVLNWARQRQAQVNKNDDVLTLCDLGTGTGAIALALASELPTSRVTGVDFLEQAVQLAGQNAKANHITNAHFLQSDWFSSLDNQRFDAIVSNPPYIEDSSPYLLEGDVRFEPSSALTSGEDGLEDIRHIIALAPKYLKEAGLLAFEHGFDQAAPVQALLQQAGFEQVSTAKDYGGNDRVTWGVLC